MDSSCVNLYCTLRDSIKSNKVEQSNRLIVELKQKPKLLNHMLIKLFILASSKFVSHEIRRSLVKELMQPALASFRLTTNHPLWLMVACGDLGTLKLLLGSHEFNLNTIFRNHIGTKELFTLLQWAIVSHEHVPADCIKIIELLLEYGADMNVVNSYGQRDFHVILNERCWSNEIANFLFEKGATVDPSDAYGKTPLNYAVCKGSEDAVKWLLDHGANINSKCNRGKTPLFVAIDNESEKIIDILLQRGANVNETMFDGTTALHFACGGYESNTGVIKKLLAFGAKISATDGENRTPFSCIRRSQSDEPVQKLFIREFAKIKFKEEIDSSLVVTDLSDLRVIDHEYPELKIFYDDCLEELRKMNAMVVHKSVYDALFTKTSRQLALLLKKDEFAKSFSACNVATSFPLYGFQFSDAIKEAYELKNVMDELDEKLYSTIGLLFPDVVMRIILRYLYLYEFNL